MDKRKAKKEARKLQKAWALISRHIAENTPPGHCVWFVEENDFRYENGTMYARLRLTTSDNDVLFQSEHMPMRES